MSRKLLIPLGLIALWSASARAEEPYYFHKQAVSREAYAADVERCAQLSGGIRGKSYSVQPLNPNAPYAVESAAIATLFIGFLQRAEQRRMMSRVERTCMADKGYQRRSIDKPLYREIRKLDDKARLDRLFELVAAPQPIGKALIE